MPEPPPASRSEFQRDRDRIVHSTAFRRLALKTQVFLPEQGDHFRTRLTHTIEVAQIARSMARALALDEDLTEALALAHDLGHTPFGHTGEDALGSVMRPFGGFDHNAQTFRIVTLIERRYPAFDGLNLTWDTLEGLLNRSGLGGGHELTRSAWNRSGILCLEPADAWSRSLTAHRRPSAEAQVAAVADDIAYNAHDIEDGLQAGLFGLGDLDQVPFLADVKMALLRDAPDLPEDLFTRGLARQLVGVFVEDALAETRRRLAALRPDNVDAIRAATNPVVGFSARLETASDAIKAFLFKHMYRHPRLLSVRTQARRIVEDIARALLEQPDRLPADWRCPEPQATPETHARRVADYVAGMTDRYAVAEHRRLFDDTPDLS